MRASTASRSPNGSLVEPLDLGAETVEIFGVAARGERRERASVKGAFESDQTEALRRAIGGVEFSRGLDRAFNRLGSGIGEENEIGEGRLDEPPGQLFGLWNLIKIGDMPWLVGRRPQRLDKMRMRIAQRHHGDSAAEIEISLSIGGKEPSALAPLESDVRSGIGGK